MYLRLKRKCTYTVEHLYIYYFPINFTLFIYLKRLCECVIVYGGGCFFCYDDGNLNKNIFKKNLQLLYVANAWKYWSVCLVVSPETCANMRHLYSEGLSKWFNVVNTVCKGQDFAFKLNDFIYIHTKVKCRTRDHNTILWSQMFAVSLLGWKIII